MTRQVQVADASKAEVTAKCEAHDLGEARKTREMFSGEGKTEGVGRGARS